MNGAPGAPFTHLFIFQAAGGEMMNVCEALSPPPGLLHVLFLSPAALAGREDAEKHVQGISYNKKEVHLGYFIAWLSCVGVN